jgi:hypothetical protein
VLRVTDDDDLVHHRVAAPEPSSHWTAAVAWMVCFRL